MVGPVLQNVYIEDLLRQLPAVKAYPDDCTISLSYWRQNSHRAVGNINCQVKGSRGEREGVASHLRAGQDTRYGFFKVPCRLIGHGRTTTV